jgi:hypothetical protein
LPIYQPPSLIGNLSRDEHVAFDWFMQKNTTRLSGLFTSAFWDTLVFQASVQEPAVRHAVIALSSAQKAERIHRGASHSAPNAEQFTLQQYNKAIGHLRGQQYQTHRGESTRIVLITCMIFVALEYLRGRYTMAFTHLQYGTSLLSEHERQHHSSSNIVPVPLEPKAEFAQTALVDAFTRLSVQATLYRQESTQVYIASVHARSHPHQVIPDVFGSVAEARRMLDWLYARIHCLKQDCQSLVHSSPPRDVEAQVHKTRHQILSDLSHWQSACQSTTLTLGSSHAARRDRLSYTLMNLYHAMATITASVNPDDEMGYDSHTHAFMRIISGCHELWLNLQRLNGNTDPGEKAECEGMGFTLEMGFIPPVYFTAVKCRVPRIRRQARDILRAGMNREGAWDRQGIAAAVAEVIRMEEGDFYSENCIPDEPLDLAPASQADLAVPRIGEERRIADVRIVLPE